MDKEVRELVDELRRQGWRVEVAAHVQAYSPDGVSIVTFASTPSDHRWKKNTISRLRRGGFQAERK